MKTSRSAKTSGVAPPRRATEFEGRKLILAWQSSGLSVADFCRHRGIPAHRVHYWKRRLAGGSSAHTDEAPAFFAVDLTPESIEARAADRSVASILIWAGESVRIELPADTSREHFVRTVRWAAEAMQR